MCSWPLLLHWCSTQNYAENLEALTSSKTWSWFSICPLGRALILVESGFQADSMHWELFMDVSSFCWLIFKLEIFFFFCFLGFCPLCRAFLCRYWVSYRGRKRKSHYHLRFVFIIIKALGHFTKFKLSLKTSDKTKDTCPVLNRVITIALQRNWMFLNQE